LFVTVGVMALLVFCLAWIQDGWPTPGLLAAAGVDFVALMIVTAVALVFSTFSTPTLSAIFSLAIFVIGRLSADLVAFADQFGGSGLRALVYAVYLVLPDLGRFQIGSQVVHGIQVSPIEIGVTVTYGLAYIAVLLLVAVAVFQQRDFK
jgi:hypothetical protein